jgi:carbonic anhydrase
VGALAELFEKNVNWSEQIARRDPEFFARLSQQQSPQYLWIGCADSRVPANQIVGLDPGELFVHRNVANLVVHTDLNCLSVMQYAVEVLQVKHIIVCGHYNCGGVAAALQDQQLGLIENWLRHIQDVRDRHRQRLAAISDFQTQCDRMCELNVIDQVANVGRTSIVQGAWRSGQDLTVHGWIYGLGDGRLRDLNVSVSGSGELMAACEAAAEAVGKSAV